MTIDLNIVHRITDTLYREARLLDECRFEEWLALLSENVEYTAPIRSDVSVGASAPQLTISYLHESVQTLGLRVRKILTGLQQTEIPASRTVRLISNVLISDAETEGYLVQSAFLLYRNHRQRDVEILAGHRDDVWIESAGDFKLRQRKIRFASNVLPTKSLSLFY